MGHLKKKNCLANLMIYLLIGCTLIGYIFFYVILLKSLLVNDVAMTNV